MSADVVKALAVALPKIANPSKDGTSHHGKFTTLAAVLDHVKPVLAEHGLAIMQTMDGDGVRTLIVHESGDVFDAGTYPVGQFANPQQQGSAISYARRYGLMAVLGVAGADDDGQAASKAPVKRSEASNIPGPRLISAKTRTALQARYSGVPRAERLARWAEIIGRTVGTANELTEAEARQLLEASDGPDL